MQGCLAHDMHKWKEINADKRRKAVLDRLDTTKDTVKNVKMWKNNNVGCFLEICFINTTVCQ